MAVSKENSKIGKISNVSLTPIKSCGNCKSCSNKCYALKAYIQYPTVRNSWDENLTLANNNPDEYFTMIANHIAKNVKNINKRMENKYFRWHVSGDILDQNYLIEMISIAKEFPQVNFLVFTKMFNLNYSNIPDNLNIVFSVFPSMPDSEVSSIPSGFQKAWVQDGTEKRIPENSFKCTGLCHDCMVCFHKNNNDVYFDIH